MSFRLVAEERLAESQQAVDELMSRHENIRWSSFDPPSREALGRHFLFSDEGALRGANLGHLSALDAFYNGYYWLVTFSKRYQLAFGQDAGVEQQVFQALERAPVDVDWAVVAGLARTVEELEPGRLYGTEE